MILFVGLVGLLITNMTNIVKTGKAVDLTHTALEQSSSILGATIDMETGMRGFLLSGKEDFLTPYREGEKKAHTLFNQLRLTVLNNPEQVARLDKAQDILKEWQLRVSDPTITLRRNIDDSKTMNDLARQVRESRGKTFFDKFRQQINAFIQQEGELLKRRHLKLRTARSSVDRNFSAVDETTEWINHTLIVLAAASELKSNAIDIESSMRGYLLTGNEELLAPYTTGKEVFFTNLNKISTLVKDNQVQTKRIKEIKVIIEKWMNKITKPAIQMRRDIANGTGKLSDITAFMAQKKESRILDQFRHNLAFFSEAELSLMNYRKAEAVKAKGIVAANLSVMSENEKWVTHTLKVIQSAKDVLASAIDMETGMRGYLLAGKEAFLAPYNNGSRAFYKGIDKLQKTVADNLDQVERLQSAQKTIVAWQQVVAGPSIKLRRTIGTAKTMDDIADVTGKALGKHYFDAFRTKMADFKKEERRLLSIQQAVNENSIQTTKVIIPTTSFLALVLAGILAWKIGSGIANPLRETTLAIENLATSTSLDSRSSTLLPQLGRRDEIGSLTKAFNSMTLNINASKDLAAEAAAKLEKSNEDLAFQKYALDEHAIVSIANIKGDITYVNNKFCAISGYSRAELIGNNHKIVKSDEHSDAFFKDMWKTIASGETWQGKIKNKNKEGEAYWVKTTIVPTLDKNGTPFQYVGIRTEITKEINNEQQLLKTQTYLQNASIELEKSNEDLTFQKFALDEHAIISIADVKGNITYVNAKFCAISGYSRAELIGNNHKIVKSDEHSEAFFVNMWKTIAKGKTWQGEIKNRNKEGEAYWVKTTIVPTLDENRKPFQYVGIRTEITKAKAVEHQLILARSHLEEQVDERTQELQSALQAEKDSAVMQKQFVSMASHEFRTPLSIIDMTAQRLLKRHDSMSEKQIIERFQKIRGAAKRITGLIESTLSSARLEDGKVDYTCNSCDVRRHVLECVETQMDVAKGYKINTDLTALPELIQADSGHLNQIFTNLLSNAVKYSPNNKNINIKGWTKNKHAFISFTDFGIGIPENEQPKMFNRFFRTSSAAGIPGTGIGLNLIKQLVEIQGGDLSFKSADGQGSTFTVSLLIEPELLKQT